MFHPSLVAPTLDTPFSIYELNLVLSSLKDSTPGIDGIPYSFLINASDQLLSYYLDIVNPVLITGNVPITWYTQTIIPIFKNKENPDDPAAYRPIALFSVLAKIAEHLVKNSLAWIAESHGLLTGSQYGFRKVQSKSLQALQLHLHSVELELSASKSNLVVFSRKRTVQDVPVILVGSGFPVKSPLSFVVYFLTPNYREPITVTTLSQKLKKNISILRWLSGTWLSAHPYFHKLLYNTIVHSHLDYGSFLLEPMKSICLMELNLVQDRDLRIIVGSMKSSPKTHFRLNAQIHLFLFADSFYLTASYRNHCGFQTTP
ncbi:RNA-directed DNA polymerase from mobile element jockey [Eumeta japonica]|uniref:RNA-directed DNA polymerase from mobile element jockey n=1 Tax=Eumeta variegata TaxID=151549 RepID=A0A4C1VFF2_EUMVA|nr:RNA-directed DNA polymerase from mobile element jockey [Eumeta japonica]